MKSILIFLLLFIPLLSFPQKEMEIHGHRGFRGLFPENTIVAFKEAAKAGADYIELDVVISKDSQVVVSHEPWFNPAICSSPDGKPITKGTKNNLHRLDYSEIKKYDCGKRGNKKFPDQAKISAYKPLLSEVIAELEKYTKENNLPPLRYNIEIKNHWLGGRKYHFETTTTVALIKDVLRKQNLNERILIQSFDTRCLKQIHRLNPALKTGLLVGNPRSVKHNIHKLGFTPDYYNPSLKICKMKTVTQAKKAGCKVVVWTVNLKKDIERMKEYDVDGIISDYPNFAGKFR